MELFIRKMALIGLCLFLQNSITFAADETDLLTGPDGKTHTIAELDWLAYKNETRKLKSFKIGALDKETLLKAIQNMDPFIDADGQPVKDVLDGNVDMPGITSKKLELKCKGKGYDCEPARDEKGNLITKTVTEFGLPWEKTLEGVRQFLNVFGPRDASLRKAWFQIKAAKLMMNLLFTLAKDRKDNDLPYKTVLFGELVPHLKEMRKSLKDEFNRVTGVRMWFSDTRAAKEVTLVTLPIVIAALDRVEEDYEKLEGRVEKAKVLALKKEKRAQIQRENASMLEGMKETFENRNKDVRVLENKHLHPLWEPVMGKPVVTPDYDKPRPPRKRGELQEDYERRIRQGELEQERLRQEQPKN